ncbi:MAG TPA: glycosyltransferase family 2 protein [Nitrososphaerales archaeon]|nr:glycosyltransferase family 2 protein [Nitrososphaerales archaeon]
MPDLLFWILVSLDLLVGVGWILLLLYNARELSSYRNFVLKGPSTSNDEVVSVIVPTRNEEMMIARCLRSIAEQTHRKLEIVVVDDGSTDRTAEMAASIVRGDGRARMVHGEELPEGWVGKNWACNQGFRVSRGEWLLFVDSDSILARDAVERTLSHAKRNGKDVVSIFPRGELSGFWAKMVWPVLASLIRLLYPLRSVNDRKGRSALLFGAFILIKREAYERIGGHQAVRGDFVEDKQMANNLKANGIPLEVLLDGEVVTAGLAGGFTAIWSSIKRIASNPLREKKLAGFGFVLAGLMLFIFPPLTLGLSAISGTVTSFFIVAASISVLSPAAIATYDLRNTTSRSYGFTLLAFAAGTMIMLGILRQILGGASYTWRGRTYKTQRRRDG